MMLFVFVVVKNTFYEYTYGSTNPSRIQRNAPPRRRISKPLLELIPPPFPNEQVATRSSKQHVALPDGTTSCVVLRPPPPRRIVAADADADADAGAGAGDGDPAPAASDGRLPRSVPPTRSRDNRRISAALIVVHFVVVVVVVELRATTARHRRRRRPPPPPPWEVEAVLPVPRRSRVPLPRGTTAPGWW